MLTQNDVKLFKKVADKYTALIESSKSRGLTFDISLADLTKVYKAKRCFYTGVPFTENDPLTIDRKDNVLGYVTGNIVACSRSINSKKGNLSIKEIRQLAKKLL